MHPEPSCIALIPARSGSKRVADKNIRPLAGHPLIAYTIAAARQSGVFRDVVVSTDSERYAAIARHYGAETPFLRPEEISGDTSPDIEWVDYTLRRLAREGRRYECFSILRPTSPFRLPETIRRAWSEFRAESGVDSLRAVEKCSQHPGKMWIVRGRRMMPLLPFGPEDRPWHSSQYPSLPVVYVQNASLEIAWTLIPSVLLAIVAVPTVRTIFASYAPAPANALKIDVYGWQWWWEFRYVVGKDTIRTANEVHVPVGRPVELRLHGGDVLHSFWIPKMGGKRDVIPNRVNRIVFTAEEPGVYLGQCAEFCGDSHALMKMRLIAHTPENFERWLRHEASPALPVQDSAIAIGQQIFLQRCIACHMVRGTQASIGRVGPDLTHVASRGTIAAGVLENNAANLVRWIDNPQAVKPGAKMPRLGLTPQELRFVVAYLQTLY